MLWIMLRSAFGSYYRSEEQASRRVRAYSTRLPRAQSRGPGESLAESDYGSCPACSGSCYAALSDRTTETFTRYPSEPRIRISRSVDTCSRSSFKMAVTLVREVPARFAISAWASLASRAESPRAEAGSSGVEATIGLSLGIQDLLCIKFETNGLDIFKQRHEAEIHVDLLMAVEQREAGIVRHKIDIHLLVTAQHHHIFDDTRGRLPGHPRQLETVP